mmetsp:Transcript_31266/g.52290  ORF Transcript_31266/g.52290 Transcript_31266/m.52290 type:complete len:443 (-) Transcript_31266:117-1445(-)
MIVQLFSLIVMVIIHHTADGWRFQMPKHQLVTAQKATKGIIATVIAGTTILGSGVPSSIQPPTAQAVIAPIADVGIKEFLVKDGRQFLRITIPLGKDNKFGTSPEAIDIKQAQDNLELVRLRFEQVGYTNPSAWGAVLKDANTAANTIKANRGYLLGGKSGAGGKTAAEALFDDVLSPQLDRLSEAVRAKDVRTTLAAQETAAQALADLRILQLPPKQIPFQIPEEYAGLPRLLGRATVEVQIKAKNGFRLPDGKTVVPQAAFLLTVDGYHAPITAGNFVDLVTRKFYDNTPIQQVEQLTIQVGRPAPGASSLPDGTYIDPGTKKPRTIPLELFYKQDAEPTYGITSDDDLRATDTMALPFQAYGALGMARNNDSPDTASTQFFFLKWMQALIAPGRNTLDGFYSCFGYVTQNEDLLSQVNVKTDTIVSAKVVKGLENLIIP